MSALIDEGADDGKSLIETTGRLMDFDHASGRALVLHA